MKTKNDILSLLFLTVSIATASCSPDKGDMRNKNLERATLSRFDHVSGIKYVGMSDAHKIDGDKFQTVIIYCVADSLGNGTEYNVRVIANDDCSEIYSWEEMNTHVLSDVRQKVNEKMEEKGIGLGGSLIDALIELKKR